MLRIGLGWGVRGSSYFIDQRHQFTNREQPRTRECSTIAILPIPNDGYHADMFNVTSNPTTNILIFTKYAWLIDLKSSRYDADA